MWAALLLAAGILLGLYCLWVVLVNGVGFLLTDVWHPERWYSKRRK